MKAEPIKNRFRASLSESADPRSSTDTASSPRAFDTLMSMDPSKVPVIGHSFLDISDLSDISEIDTNPEKLAPRITEACKNWGCAKL
jgi:hypothetical protein